MFVKNFPNVCIIISCLTLDYRGRTGCLFFIITIESRLEIKHSLRKILLNLFSPLVSRMSLRPLRGLLMKTSQLSSDSTLTTPFSGLSVTTPTQILNIRRPLFLQSSRLLSNLNYWVYLIFRRPSFIGDCGPPPTMLVLSCLWLFSF